MCQCKRCNRAEVAEKIAAMRCNMKKSIPKDLPLFLEIERILSIDNIETRCYTKKCAKMAHKGQIWQHLPVSQPE